MDKKALTIIGVFAIIILTNMGVRYIVRQGIRASTSEDISVSKLTDQQYIDIASKNCAKDGEATEAECRCIYSKLINEFGKSYVYDFDKTADDPSRPFTNREIEIVNSCI